MSRRFRPLFPLGIPGNGGGSLQEFLASLALMFGEHGEDEGLERKRTGLPFRSQILGNAELGKEPRALLSPLLSCSRKNDRLCAFATNTAETLLTSASASQIGATTVASTAPPPPKPRGIQGFHSPTISADVESWWCWGTKKTVDR